MQNASRLGLICAQPRKVEGLYYRLLSPPVQYLKEEVVQYFLERREGWSLSVWGVLQRFLDCYGQAVLGEPTDRQTDNTNSSYIVRPKIKVVRCVLETGKDAKALYQFSLVQVLQNGVRWNPRVE